MVASPVFFDLPSFLMELDSQYGQDSIGMEFMNSTSSLDGLRCFASYHSEMVETNILDDPSVSENLAFRASSWFIFIIGGSTVRGVFPRNRQAPKMSALPIVKNYIAFIIALPTVLWRIPFRHVPPNQIRQFVCFLELGKLGLQSPWAVWSVAFVHVWRFLSLVGKQGETAKSQSLICPPTNLFLSLVDDLDIIALRYAIYHLRANQHFLIKNSFIW